MSDRDNLLAMGFPEANVTKALRATQNAGLPQALDYLEKHADEDASFWEATDDADEGDAMAVDAEAKFFRNQALAQYHSTKSGHTDFEESTEELKPLTEEEKAQKLQELRERMAEKKKAQAKLDAEENRRNEEIRRKSGKDEAAAREQLKLKEAERQAALRKKEKADELAARKRIKEQIEADKRARAEKAAREKALREGRNPDEAAAAVSGGAAPAPAVPVVASSAAQPAGEKKTYDSARLQIRVPGGAPLVHSLPGTSTLREVVEWVKEQTGLASVSLTCSFPRKTYGDADLDKDLKTLGLVPSAVLLVQ
ncbi:hypothetical protein Rhopal_006810-T1 [Rhodotorula paludigena]|uniref:UBX domain-containing protein n=1 Tax=Rhodotorula paludigena TaxID=86838 RepID=A0AAV5GU55_9BASI|nr:hypothetical protein Rhopal_006810-T1 [Rhodotorula paludigena]